MGSYLLLEERVRGADGDLYGGRDVRSGKAVVLRLLPEEEGGVDAARRAAGLIHPHLAAWHDAGEYRGRAYVVGEDAGDARLSDASLSLREAVAFIRDAATGVAHAAGRGLAHPGLHPDYLRRTRKGRLFVTGYERAASGGPAAYRAPEVRSGKPVDAAANVYSLGAVLYALAVGREPGLEAVEPPSRANPLVPGEVEDLLLRALDAEPRRRPGLGAFAAGLSRWLDGPPSAAAAPAPAAAPLWRRAWEELPPRGRRMFAAGAVVLAALGLAGLFAAAKRGGSAPPEEVASTPPPVVTRRPAPAPTKPDVETRAPAPAKVVAAPEPPPAPRPEPPPAPPPPPVERAAPRREPPLGPSTSRVGTVTLVHPEYGVFVRLEAPGGAAAGDVLEVLRDAGVVATLKVLKISRPESVYPHGAAVCEAGAPGAAEGLVVRRAKP